MKLVQITIPDEKIEGLNEILDKNRELVSSVTKIYAGGTFLVLCRCSESNISKLLGHLDEAEITKFGAIDVIPVEIAKPELISEDTEEFGIKERKAVEIIYQTVKEGNRLSFDFFAYLTIAALIAGAGLVSNSAVTVVASMLVSPLMGPIVALSLAPLIRDKRMALTALKNELIALFIAILLGIVIGFLFLPFRSTTNWPTDEMKLRMDVTGLGIGVLVALPSGAGVSLAMTSGGVNSLVGVAISASLLPPAVVAGMNVVFGTFGPFIYTDIDSFYFFQGAGISLSLTLINIVCINMMAMIFFKIKAVAPVHFSVPFRRLGMRRFENMDKNQLYHNVV